MAWQAALLGRALAVNPRSPQGSRRKARGVDGESARRATMMGRHHAANVTAVLLILFPLLRLPLFNRSKAEPFFAMQHSLHQLISGRNRVRTKILCSRRDGEREMFYSPGIPRSSALGEYDGSSDSEQSVAPRNP